MKQGPKAPQKAFGKLFKGGVDMDFGSGLMSSQVAEDVRRDLEAMKDPEELPLPIHRCRVLNTINTMVVLDDVSRLLWLLLKLNQEENHRLAIA